MKKIFSIALATLLALIPFTACAKQSNAEGENSQIVFPLPELPSTEEILPEEPVETPSAPSEEELPEEPEVQPLPNPEPAPEQTPTPAPPKPLVSQYVRVKTNGLNVRTGAGTNFSSLGTVEQGVLLKYIRTVGGWYETFYKNRVAYVSAGQTYSAYQTLGHSNAKAESVIDYGLKFLGVPYVYGAVRYHDGYGNKLKNFTVTKFDCSSLMQYIFYLGAGVLLNTTTRTQVVQGKKVTDEIQRGDLLFFTNAQRYNNTGVERVGHVALYLGDNYILHTASDYAKVEQISQKRWSYYLSARRFF